VGGGIGSGGGQTRIKVLQTVRLSEHIRPVDAQRVSVSGSQTILLLVLIRGASEWEATLEETSVWLRRRLMPQLR